MKLPICEPILLDLFHGTQSRIIADEWPSYIILIRRRIKLHWVMISDNNVTDGYLRKMTHDGAVQCITHRDYTVTSIYWYSKGWCFTRNLNHTLFLDTKYYPRNLNFICAVFVNWHTVFRQPLFGSWVPQPMFLFCRHRILM